MATVILAGISNFNKVPIARCSDKRRAKKESAVKQIPDDKLRNHIVNTIIDLLSKGVSIDDIIEHSHKKTIQAPKDSVEQRAMAMQGLVALDIKEGVPV